MELKKIHESRASGEMHSSHVTHWSDGIITAVVSGIDAETEGSIIEAINKSRSDIYLGNPSSLKITSGVIQINKNKTIKWDAKHYEIKEINPKEGYLILEKKT